MPTLSECPYVSLTKVFIQPIPHFHISTMEMSLINNLLHCSNDSESQAKTKTPIATHCTNTGQIQSCATYHPRSDTSFLPPSVCLIYLDCKILRLGTNSFNVYVKGFHFELVGITIKQLIVVMGGR